MLGEKKKHRKKGWEAKVNSMDEFRASPIDAVKGHANGIIPSC